MGKRKGCKNGIITQKMICFKLDLDNLLFWESLSNKSKYINDYLRECRIKLTDN